MQFCQCLNYEYKPCKNNVGGKNNTEKEFVNLKDVDVLDSNWDFD